MHPDLNSCSKTEQESTVKAGILTVCSSAGMTELAGVKRKQKWEKRYTFWHQFSKVLHWAAQRQV